MQELKELDKARKPRDDKICRKLEGAEVGQDELVTVLSKLLSKDDASAKDEIKAFRHPLIIPSSLPACLPASLP